MPMATNRSPSALVTTPKPVSDQWPQTNSLIG
jgi:hypothetical protein